MTEAGIILKVNIKEIAKLKEVAKHLDEIKAKATAFDAVKNKVPKVKKEVKKLTDAQKELIKKTKETENVFKSMSIKAIGATQRMKKPIEENGRLMKIWALRIKKTTGELQKLYKQRYVIAAFSHHINKARRGMIMWGARISETSKKVIGFGKNIQWTGRQLMMGFTLPLAYASVTAVKTAMTIEASWVRVKKVYGDTVEEANSFAQTQREILAPAVEQLSLAFAEQKKNVVDVMAEWAAMGWTGKALAGIVQETMGYMVAGDIEAAEATEYLRGIVAIFNLDVKETRLALAQLNAVENATAATMKDLGEAITRAGEAIRVAGLSVAETAAFIAQMRDAGVQATTAGMALKTMIARLYAPSKDAKQMVAAFSQATHGFAINMDSASFQAMAFKDRVKLLAEVYTKLSDAQKVQMAEMLTGIRQFSRFATVLEGLSSEASVYERAMKAALDPEVVRRYGREIMDVLESAPRMWKRLMVSIENLAASWGKVISEGLMPAVKWLIGLTTALKQLDPALTRNIFYVTTFLAVLGPVLMYIGFTTQAIMILVQAFGQLAVFVGLSSGSILIFIGVVIALLAALKLNIGGIGDFMKSLWSNIKGLTFKLNEFGNVIDNATTATKQLGDAGKDLGDDFSEGLSEGLDSVDLSLLRNQMEQFGVDLQRDFLKGFSEMDIDILNSAISMIRDYYNDLLTLEKISVEEAAIGMREAVQSVAQAIEESRVTGDMINIYDELKDKIGEVNAEMIQGLSAAKQKVKVIEDELKLKKDAMEAARNEYNAQRDYVNFLTRTNKDVSIEISTTEKKRMWEIKAKIKEIRKANLEEIQAEKRKMLMLAKTASDKKEEFNLKEEELKIAKELLRIEQKIVQLRLGLLDAIRAKGATGGIAVPTLPTSAELIAGMEGVGAGIGDMMGDVGGVGGMVNEIGRNFEELGSKFKKLGEIAMWVGGSLLVGKLFKALKWLKVFEWKPLYTNVAKLTAALKALSLIGVITITIMGTKKTLDALKELRTEIDDSLESALALADMQISIGKPEQAILDLQEFNRTQKEIDDSLKKWQRGFKGVSLLSGMKLFEKPIEILVDEWLGGGMKAVIKNIADSWKNLFDWGDVWGDLTGFLQESKEGFRLWGQDIVKSVANTFDSIVLFFAELPGRIVKNLPIIFMRASEGLIRGIKDLFGIKEAQAAELELPLSINMLIEENDIIKKLTDPIKIITEAWKNLPNNIYNSLKNLADWVWKPFADLYQGFQSKVWTLINDIASWFQNLPNFIVSSLWNLPNAIWGKFASLYGNFQTKIWKFIDDIASWFSWLPGKIRGAISGIGGLTDKIANAIFSSFQAGGIVPGQISQAVPIVAHGREMILNMGQQSKLFDLLSGGMSLMQYQPAAASQEAIVNYNIEFKVGNMIASPGERRAFAREIEKTLQEDHRRRGPNL